MEFDEAKDYYGILGVGPKATFEELKAAHILLALKFHPDTAHSSSTPLSEATSTYNIERFRDISEAWSILQKTEVRSRYDSVRIQAGKMTGSDSLGGVGTGEVHIEIPTSYNTQRENFAVAVKKAGHSWKDNRDKYKCEKWNKLTHSQKVLSRTRSHGSLLGNTLVWSLPVSFAIFLTYTFYDTCLGKKSDNPRFKFENLVGRRSS